MRVGLVLTVVVFFLLSSVGFVSAGETEEENDSLTVFDLLEDGDLEGFREALTQGGAEVMNKQGPGGQTPLMYATLKGDLEAVKILVELGADGTIGEQQGYTPLHGASFQGRAEVAKYLIENGYDPLDVHEDGFAAFHRCLWGNEDRHVQTLKVFLEAGAPPDFAARNGKKPIKMTKNKKAKELIQAFLKQRSMKGQAEVKEEL